MEVTIGAKLDAICRKIKNDEDRREAMSLARMFLSWHRPANPALHGIHGVSDSFCLSSAAVTC